MKDHYVHARTCVYNVHYHIVWCVKYRRKVLSDEKAAFLKEEFSRIAKKNGYSVAECEVGLMDHVHVFVDAAPKFSISTIVKQLKGESGFSLFHRYPELKDVLRNGTFWNGSYFVETIGSTSEENVKAYIQRQQNVFR